jgi:hypothetical protein
MGVPSAFAGKICGKHDVSTGMATISKKAKTGGAADPQPPVFSLRCFW